MGAATSARSSGNALLLIAILPALASPLPVGAAAPPARVPTAVRGRAGETLDPGNIAPYLALHKARAMERMRAMRTVETPNQSAWDARTYDLTLLPDVASSVLTGIVRMRATVVNGPIVSMDLDLLSNMVVDSAYVGAAPAGFGHTGDILTVSLDRAYVNGEDVEVTTRYHGTPAGGPFGSVFAFDRHDGTPLLWTLSEPFGARAWWPCKDYPEDKADSVDIRVTTPSGMISACNGTRVEFSDDGLKAFAHWHERHPIATYLVSLASYAYTVSTDAYQPPAGDPMGLEFYLFPETVSGAAAVDAKVKGMIAAYAARFGDYAFLDEKYGEAEFQWGGGMENQTLTSLGDFSEPVVAHELGHQWWGDMVTCRDFHHVWLNEGFATYCVALWNEAGGGLPAYHSTMSGARYFGPGTVYAPDESDPYRLFDSDLTYNKGSWVLHMLRHVLGDTTFFTGLRSYGQQNRYGTATTEGLRDAMAAVSGRDLSKFFTEWVYGEYYPQYLVGSYSTPAGGGYDVEVGIEQVQSGQLFWMPVDVRITDADGPHTFVAMDSLPAQTFTFHVAQTPLAVDLDPDEWILRTVAPLSLAAGGRPPLLAARLLPARPNPSHGRTLLSFWLPAPGPAHLTLVDVTGARVRGLWSGALGAGLHELAWDGRDDRGRPAAPGVYTALLDTDAGRREQRLVLLR